MVDRARGLGGYGPASVDWLANEIEHPAQCVFTDWDGNGLAGIVNVHAALYAVSGAEGDGADRAAAQMLGDFAPECFLGRLAQHLALNLELQGVIDLRQIVFCELRIERGADD